MCPQARELFLAYNNSLIKIYIKYGHCTQCKRVEKCRQRQLYIHNRLRIAFFGELLRSFEQVTHNQRVKESTLCLFILSIYLLSTRGVCSQAPIVISRQALRHPVFVFYQYFSLSFRSHVQRFVSSSVSARVLPSLVVGEHVVTRRSAIMACDVTTLSRSRAISRFIVDILPRNRQTVLSVLFLWNYLLDGLLLYIL